MTAIAPSPSPASTAASHRTARGRWYLAAAGLAVVVTAYSLTVASVPLPFGDVVDALTGRADDALSRLIWDYQIPRIILCWAVGAGLGASGAVLQSVIRNPLASPDVLGVTRGAGVTALFVVLILPATPLSLLPVAALAGGVTVTVVVYTLAYRGGTTPIRLALVGVAASACCEAVIRFLLMRYPQNVNGSLIWLAGSFFGRTWQTVAITVPWVVVCLPVVVFLGRRLDVMGLGDPMAVGLGERAEGTRRLAIAVAVVLASGAVAAAGTLSFVSLIAPHIARRLIGGRMAALTPMAAAVGVLLTLGADTLGRGISPPLEIPAGLITAVIGAPYFLYLLMRTGR
ncbi:FecCD family ABC transporter permease [Microtetraspora malaysiensis]|uniref:FecCD family ABC transporter permease n=1 Tax=Microtetraspora malaysiensis TaxID=161358 RepID=UPI000A05622E|nr:iron ABC transporter permease [Microtetraspora malaysiensis]